MAYSFFVLWQTVKVFPHLEPRMIHIWQGNLAQPAGVVEKYATLLNVEEQERAARFITQELTNKFIVARGMLRQLLAGYLTMDPCAIAFDQNQYGKLHLASSELQFNLSHAHEMAAFIFALNSPVGIDVEFVRENSDHIEIAQKFFSKQEAASLVALPLAERLLGFFNCWTRKEAFIKALGLGMFYALDKFTVAVNTKRTGKVELNYQSDLALTKDWTLEAFDPGEGYVGAFSCLLQEYNVCYYQV